jgi:hypothetical protein
MRVIAFLILLALFVMLVIHVIKTDTLIEEMERIEREAVEFARYCFENNYQPEDCR